MEFEGEHIELRPFVLTDAEGLARVASDRKVKAALLIPHPFTFDDALAFIESAESMRDAELYAISFDGVVIGVAGLVGISEEHNKARLYAWIGSYHEDDGFLEEAIGLVLRRAFVDLRLRRVSARTFTDDKAMIKRLRSFGFKTEGTLRDAVRVRNRYHDVKAFGLLRSEYSP